MKGKLYGVSVGPGDPGLVTLKAKKILEECDVIAYPMKKPGEVGVAIKIIEPVVDMTNKVVEGFLFDMNPNDPVREKCRAEAIDRMCSILESGKKVAMVTLGDAGVYSTFMYTCGEIKGRGYDVDVIPGIPSFCHGASVAGLPLMIGNEGLAIVPVAKENSKLLSTALDCFDNVVVMKAFKSVDTVIDMMDEKGIDRSAATVICDVGLEGEYVGPVKDGMEYGYFTTMLIKKGGKKQ